MSDGVCPFAFLVSRGSTRTIGAYTFEADTPRTVPEAFWTDANAGQLGGMLARYEVAAYDYAGAEIAPNDAAILLGNYMAQRAEHGASYAIPTVTLQPGVTKLVAHPIVECDMLPSAKVVTHGASIEWRAGDVLLVVTDDTSPTAVYADVGCDDITWGRLEQGAVMRLFNAAKDFVRVTLPDGQKAFVQPRAELHVIKLGDTQYTYCVSRATGAIEMTQHFVTAGGTAPGGWRAVGSGGSANWGVYSPQIIGAVSLNGPSSVGGSYRLESGSYIVQSGRALMLRAVFLVSQPWADSADDSMFWIGVGLPSGNTLSRALGVRYSAADGGALVGVVGSGGNITSSTWTIPVSAGTPVDVRCILRSDWDDATWFSGDNPVGTVSPFPALSAMQPIALIEKVSGGTAHGVTVDMMQLAMTL